MATADIPFRLAEKQRQLRGLVRIGRDLHDYSFAPSAVPSPPLGDPMTAGYVTGEPSYATRLTDRVNPSCLITTRQIATERRPE